MAGYWVCPSSIYRQVYSQQISKNGAGVPVVQKNANTVNPSLEEYYVELMALVFLALGFYRLSAFAFRAGRVRVFSVYCGASVILSLAALADAGKSIELPSLLLYLGGAAVLLGFLILLLAEPSAEEDPAE